MTNEAFWRGKKVFITGHTGFKGSWLAIWLNKLGAIVSGYALEPQTTPSLYNMADLKKKIYSTYGDIRDLSSLQKAVTEFNPDIVFHMAAQPLVTTSYENPVETYDINVMGTVNLLESVRNCSSVKAVINVTTDKVYENKEWIWGYKETDRLGGYDPYSSSKACSELVTASYTDAFFNPEHFEKHGVAIATVRAGNVIGGGDWAENRLIPDLVRAIEKKEKIEIRYPNAIRPWQHVIEPLSGYLKLAKNLYEEGYKWNGAWNFGPNSCDVTVMDVVKLFTSQFDHKVSIVIESAQVHETSILKLNCEKARNVLQWQPLLDTNQAIILTSQWYKNWFNRKNAFDNVLDQIEEVSSKGLIHL